MLSTKSSNQSSMPSLKKSKSQYAKVAEELAQKIENGFYKIGDLLPSEADLCKHYNISNHTVRHAMRVLQDMKLAKPHSSMSSRAIPVAPCR